MEVSPQTIRDVEFREKLRGYHQDDVDGFLEQVAAGVEILQDRLRQATERAVRAEQKSSESREDEESLRRTLVLAQRTADLAVREGQEQAERILAEAEAEAASRVEEAAREADRLTREAQNRLWADVERLGEARDQLMADAAGLVQWIDEQRAEARAVLTEAAGRLDEMVPPPPPLPPLHDVDLDALRRFVAGDQGEAGAAPRRRSR